MAQPQDLAASGVVVGMKELTGQVGTRVDVDVMLTTQPDTFNLFMQALGALEQNPSLLGYYQLSGIHGFPTNTWDDVNKKFGDAYGGYCAHGVLIFPTWHRPYLSLVEQTVYLKMVEIAGKYDQPQRQRYLDAAKGFRLPYLDYFRPRGGNVSFPGIRRGSKTSFPYDFRLPDIFNEQKVALKLPPQDSLQTGIDNPLYTYKFTSQSGQLPQRDQNAIKRDYSTTQTVRYPDSLSSTTHNLQELSDALNSGREARNILCLDVLYSKPYGNLETVASDKLAEGDMTIFRSNRASGSLEGSIHGNYHNLIGGPGHMSTPSLAAFDPVFWFHHCQVDRLWAIWQAVHPNEWFPKPEVGQLAENKKDLLPFYKSRTGAGNGTFFNSDDTKTTEFFGYIYDDFKNLPSGGDSSALRARLDNKYLWSSRTPTHPNITNPPADMRPLNVRSTYFFSKAGTRDAPRAAFAAASDAADTVQATVGDALSAVTANIKAAAEPIIPQVQQAVLGGGPNAPETAATASQKIDSTFDREWYVDSVVNRSAANGPFTIFFFLAPHGAVVTDPAHYVRSPYLAGLNHIFAAPREFCDNCGDQAAAGQLASDTAPITPLLLDYLNLPDNGLESLRPEHVKPFLVKNLRWRVVYGTNQGKDPREVPNLQISISAKIYHEDGSKTYEVYPDVVQEILQNASPVADA